MAYWLPTRRANPGVEGKSRALTNGRVAACLMFRRVRRRSLRAMTFCGNEAAAFTRLRGSETVRCPA
jgi:hypothetical protein